LNPEEQPSSPAEKKPTRVEDILLERLKNEPKIHRQIGTPVLVSIIIAIIGLGIAIYFLSRKSEKFLENPQKQEESHTSSDSTELESKRQHFQPMIDSLAMVIAAIPNDSAHLMIAQLYNECEYWDRAKPEFESYLAKHPKDIDARASYAFTLAQGMEDFKGALAEVNTALKYAPEDANLLFNAGLLAIRANLDDKESALAEATKYFQRAHTAAKKQGNEKMAEQIEQILKKVKEKPDEGK
jgi:tetratricopeptide (TPR) repeat protein